jgi:tRNA-uridine 2-sulfurtransferase
MRDLVAIALSGGIDSLVAAALLKEQGHGLIGLHFLSGYEAGPAKVNLDPADPMFAAIEAHARRTLGPLAEQLDIPLYIIDVRAEFLRWVVDYFVTTYESGKTPNPCLVCNPMIKFDLLLNKARDLGATQIATGHYARIVPAEGDRMRLLRGLDDRKEQSYFLARLTQQQLTSAILPLGAMRKEQTRRIAHHKGLIPVTAGESQDICFIRDGNYADFLVQKTGFVPRPGPIEDVNGHVIGRHTGLHRFTIGQRRGINCPAGVPYYVVRIDPDRNCLVVGSQENLLAIRCRVTHINWIAPSPTQSMRIMVRIRYRHMAVAATLTPVDAATVDIRFDKPEAAVTPGQGAAFYLGDEVLGGGWIE